jgi:hypothetical protein
MQVGYSTTKSRGPGERVSLASSDRLNLTPEQGRTVRLAPHPDDERRRSVTNWAVRLMQSCLPVEWRWPSTDYPTRVELATNYPGITWGLIERSLFGVRCSVFGVRRSAFGIRLWRSDLPSRIRRCPDRRLGGGEQTPRRDATGCVLRHRPVLASPIESLGGSRPISQSGP